uniref:Uncharacterized protein n=1 Tax=Oryza punctata TaxID=4537 RepID=A0A0E0LUI6_ORYPU
MRIEEESRAEQRPCPSMAAGGKKRKASFVLQSLASSS